MIKKRLIIIGGGFGGVQCARALHRGLKSLGDSAEVVLFDRQNHLVFSPLLAEVVGSSLNALDCVVPLRQVLNGVFCRTEEVRAIDLGANEIEYATDDGGSARMGYDHLVVACGNVTNLNVVPGMVDHSFPLKTVGDAASLRAHIMERMEQAEVASDPEKRRWHLTFLVVGGGYSGVEIAGEINDLVRGSARYFRNWRAADARVMLLHSQPEILPEISPALRQFARRKMEQAGVLMHLGRRVAAATPEGVAFEDGQFLSGGTIVCTIGSSPAPVTAKLDVPKQKGRFLTAPDMRLQDSANVWAIGDCALVINARSGQPSPTTGQFAERQGRQCAENVLRTLRGEPTRPFSFRPLGELCSIGGHSAVADLFGFHLSGFFAWFAWRGVYLFKLPTVGRRLQVGFDWAWLLAFPRDLAYIRAEQTDRVLHAHYAQGDFIIRKGDAPTNFYVLEKGEVEILRSNNGSGQEVVAVLGPGSFFGERALIANRPRVMSIRARTPVEVLVMGREVFARFSSSLAPLRDALSQTLNRRALEPWKDRPKVYELLKQTPVRELMEPAPTPFVPPTSNLREVSHAFVDHGNEFFYVTSQSGALEGVVTITDLNRSRSGSPLEPDTLVSEFMTRNPVTIAADDDCAVAANAFREYRLKTLPVVEQKNSRHVVGCLRARRLMAYVLRST